MHKISTSIRQISSADLPKVRDLDGTERSATPGELLNLGIQHIADNLYSCISQEERDPETLTWQPKDQVLPGTVITEGNLKERHDKLPSNVRGKVLRSSVIRSSLGNADDLASAVLIEAAEAAEAAVGPVRDGEPLIDVADAGMVLREAERQLEVEGSGFTRETVPMDDVAQGDVVEAEGLVPHSWAGEPKR